MGDQNPRVIARSETTKQSPNYARRLMLIKGIDLRV
jgi:hypothetical protein